MVTRVRAPAVPPGDLQHAVPASERHVLGWVGVGLLLGIAAGAAAGLLRAPKTGEPPPQQAIG